MVVEAIFYQEEDGTCPVLQFFDQLQAKDLQVTNARIALAHALTKEAQIPQADLKRALERKSLFEEDPKKHTYPGEPL